MIKTQQSFFTTDFSVIIFGGCWMNSLFFSHAKLYYGGNIFNIWGEIDWLIVQFEQKDSKRYFYFYWIVSRKNDDDCLKSGFLQTFFFSLFFLLFWRRISYLQELADFVLQWERKWESWLRIADSYFPLSGLCMTKARRRRSWRMDDDILLFYCFLLLLAMSYTIKKNCSIFGTMLYSWLKVRNVTMYYKRPGQDDGGRSKSDWFYLSNAVSFRDAVVSDAILPQTSPTLLLRWLLLLLLTFETVGLVHC